MMFALCLSTDEAEEVLYFAVDLKKVPIELWNIANFAGPSQRRALGSISTSMKCKPDDREDAYSLCRSTFESSDERTDERQVLW